jgi:hypothetical protein
VLQGPNGFGLARPRMRARVFYQWPTWLVSAGTCECKTTDHAQASLRPMVWKQNGSGGLANGCASMPAVHAPEQSGQGGFLLVRAEVFGRPCFGIACAWAEEVQPVSRKTLGFAETTPSNSYLSSIVRARPQHLKKAREPSHRALLIANPIHHGNSLSAHSPP